MQGLALENRVVAGADAVFTICRGLRDDLVARGQGMAAPKIGTVVKVNPTRIYVFDSEGAQKRLS